MPYCPSCGREVSAEMRFCPNCGQALAVSDAMVETTQAAPVVTYTQTTPVTYTQTVPVTPVNTVSYNTVNDYRLILISCGSCTKTVARELIKDTLGYTASEAKTLTNETPIELAQALSFDQALYLAQLFTEYGMQVSVYRGNDYVDLSQHASSSVFNSSGSLLTAAATALAGLTVANRVSRFLRWNRGDALRYLFAPRYRYAPPPKYERRRILPQRAPEPRPAAWKPTAPTHNSRPAGGPSYGGGHILGGSNPGGNRPGGGSHGGPGGGGHGGGPGGRR